MGQTECPWSRRLAAEVIIVMMMMIEAVAVISTLHI